MVARAGSRLLTSAAAALLVCTTLAPRPASGECRIARVDFTPEANLQIAVWVEDAQGNFISTLYVTHAVGTYGLGNRPGRYDLNSGLLFVYGRRQNALPVWAHHRGVTYPTLVFHDGKDGMLSHGANVSSPDPYYCAPQAGADVDLVTCPSVGNTGSDKGVLDPGQISYYPPRQDVQRVDMLDSDDVDLFSQMNDLDAVSRATPPGGAPYQVAGVLPASLPAGGYVLWVEVSKEFDFNDTYNPNTYPTPVDITVQPGYGDPYRGQPSVVWQLPFTLGGAELEFSTSDYAGYGDMDGLDGEVNPPDATINTVAAVYPFDQDGIGNRPPIDYPSLGQARLQLLAGPAGTYRVALQIEPYDDSVPPGQPPGLSTRTVGANDASLYFTTPGDDGADGTPTGYEVRIKAGEPLTDANFETGLLVAESLPPMPSGQTLMFDVDSLLPETTYFVGVRAFDECLSPGAARFISFTTLAAEGGNVDACFVATAAFGSLMQENVQPLRKLRDRMLRKQVLGELFVEAYYTFAPALAEVIEPSADLRALARSGLTPIIGVARDTMQGYWSEGTE